MDSDIREALGDTVSLQGLLVEKLDHLLGQPHSHQSGLFVLNKIDQLSSLERSQLVDHLEPQNPVVAVSAETGENWGQLTESLKHLMGLQDQSETLFSARTRHVSALSEASVHLAKASENLRGAQPGELIAEDLKLAQICLGEITGKISSDELLGKIFSSFCIGK
jgi:tRNA modification GTPase